jgi:hypothetical protein
LGEIIDGRRLVDGPVRENKVLGVADDKTGLDSLLG